MHTQTRIKLLAVPTIQQSRRTLAYQASSSNRIHRVGDATVSHSQPDLHAFCDLETRPGEVVLHLSAPQSSTTTFSIHSGSLNLLRLLIATVSNCSESVHADARMGSSDSDGQAPSRKRPRTHASSEDAAAKKARGRPRVHTQDDTAADVSIRLHNSQLAHSSTGVMARNTFNENLLA